MTSCLLAASSESHLKKIVASCGTKICCCKISFSKSSGKK